MKTKTKKRRGEQKERKCRHQKNRKKPPLRKNTKLSLTIFEVIQYKSILVVFQNVLLLCVQGANI